MSGQVEVGKGHGHLYEDNWYRAAGLDFGLLAFFPLDSWRFGCIYGLLNAKPVQDLMHTITLVHCKKFFSELSSEQ